MIEVVLVGSRWRWFLIGAHGQILVYRDEEFESDVEANDSAKAWRAAFWAAADQIDHRQARCL